MPKQKHGFLLFICSLIPGAGEMYLGFFKQGISIMTLFWAVVAVAGGFSTGFLVIFLPVIWFYSFFHVHNLKELPEEEFYAIEDSYILHMDQIFSDFKNTSSRQQNVVAVLLIVFGAAIVWNSVNDLLYWLLPDFLNGLVQTVMYQIPSIAIGLLIIIAGYRILTKKVKFLQGQWADTQRIHAPQASVSPQSTPKFQDFSDKFQDSSDNVPESTEVQNIANTQNISDLSALPHAENTNNE